MEGSKPTLEAFRWRWGYSVALLGIYLMCWMATIQIGIPQFVNNDPLWIAPGVVAPRRLWSPAPFVIVCDEGIDITVEGYRLKDDRRRYFLWLLVGSYRVRSRGATHLDRLIKW